MADQYPTSYPADHCGNQSHGDIGAEPVDDEANNFFDFDAWIQMDQLVNPTWPSVGPDSDAGIAQFSFEGHEVTLDESNDLQSFETDNCNRLGCTQIVESSNSYALGYVDSGLSPRVNSMGHDGLGTTTPDDETPVDHSADHQDDPIPDIPIHTTLAPRSGIEMENFTPAEVHGSVANRINTDFVETSASPSSKRTRISKQAKDVLQTHFRTNPYPNKEETLSLSKATKLTLRTIKTWFTNTRSRIKAINGECNEPSKVDMPNKTYHAKEHERATRGVSTASLEALEKISPSGSTSSLQRWLDTPANEDAVVSLRLRSPQSFQSLLQVRPSDLNVPTHNKSVRKSSPWLKSPASDAEDVTRSYKASSVASSRSSRASDSSSISRCSFKSKDARGPRRGRKAWRRSHSTNEGREGPEFGSPGGNVGYPNPDLIAKGKATRKYFCTAQTCEAAFMFPFEWLRHEEALHYQPYHWICCLETNAHLLEILPLCWICGELNVTPNHFAIYHFSPCAEKEHGDRMFLREDQLLQHINGVHLTTRVSKKIAQHLLSSWKIDNPAFDKKSLVCGFCGEVSDTWQERYKHVSEHIRQGACKTAWWPEGSFLVESRTTYINTNGPFNCPYCGIRFENLRVASEEHFQCLTWSCQNLQDPQAVLNRDKRWRGSNHDDCRLCDYFRLYSSNDRQRLREKKKHEEFHRLCDCTEEVYVRFDDFVSHLQSKHRAKTLLQSDLDPWKLQLSLIWRPGRVVWRSRRFIDLKPVCGGKEEIPVGDR
ncbi:hypothetical protein BKA63DRAFT_102062 [Paraphoma chrysanthemicola]|nr:hypothetical protein BKA63DRAFT_102062 [Paraphoma chrysanthemicola]